MSSLKNEITLNSGSEFEVESQDLHLESKIRSINRIHSLRLALTALALGVGVVVLGTSADSLATYSTTHLPADFFLQLWPEKFDLGPTTALVAGSGLIILANGVSLFTSKTQSIRQRAGPHAAISLFAPVVGFLAALVAMSLFYAANASTDVDTLQSWACRWEAVPMMVAPHWGTLCKQSQAAVALSVVLVPLEAFILGLAGYQAVLEKQVYSASHEERV
ncbi:hypothetical protein PT974_10575 [Cladobotryum mycophilum]|uniref:Uncharacterized protein n=1 Tax=Cladobotryum mycophilum TaxID=491253 RepID=A0ABR0SA90_9HYPO